MWDLQGYLLYKSIEHRNDRQPSHRDGIDDIITAYDRRIHDPRVDIEAAKKIAA